MNIRRSFVLAASFITLIVSGCSQPRNATDLGLEPQFGTPAADNAYAVAKSGPAVYVVGITSGDLHAPHKGGGDAFVRKVGSDGRLLWGRQFGTAASDRATDVATDAGGNAYVLGQTGGTLARALRGPSDFFLRKYGPSGNVVWTRQMGLDTADLPGGVAVSGSSVYVVGSSEDLGTFVYRFGPNGGTWWKKRFGTNAREPSTPDIAAGGGDVYVAGSVPAPCEEPNSFSNCSNVKVDKYNASGTPVWSRQVSLAQRNTLHAVAAHGSSVYLLDESFDVPDDDSFTQLVKLDAAGTVQWTRSIGLADVYSPPTYISTDLSADGRGIYTASTQLSYWDNRPDPQRITYSVARLDLSGSLVWRAGELFDYGDFEGPVGTYIDGSLEDVLVRGSELYVAGSTDGGAGRGSEALLQRLNAATGATVWKR